VSARDEQMATMVQERRKQMKTRFVRCCLAGAVAFTLCGCATYYKVTDPASGRIYYTDNIDHKGNGVIRFKDDVSKNQVTLSASEVMQITKDQYKANAHPK
jgi:hypothetical protein